MTIRPLLASTIGLLLLTQAVSAATPPAFTATYNVLQGDQPMGQATVTLRAAENGEWIYSKDVKGTGGLAALMGASAKETSRFRWKGDVPEAISYDYQMIAMGKNKQRHLSADWKTNQVTVDDNKGSRTYAAIPGMVERNTAALALGIALRDGKQQIVLPMGVKQGIETQQFKVTGKEIVKVAAGTFNAERIDRTDKAQDFSAWYAPTRYPVPVKLSQHEGGDLTMELVSFQSN
ncbi:DUF3108 domain-containing protein [Rhodanobacter sp. L36]|uniref:DUF3108 domain-containing protein n=1 Tax=Rhodanobacter sp. L36 TaxID=1747221 RepID=UPI00131D1F26|nr:DUF3108 domain-containing protein [Rhodanobacter sp. L36]